MSLGRNIALALATAMLLIAAVHGAASSCNVCTWDRATASNTDCLDTEGISKFSQTCADPNSVCFTQFTVDLENEPAKVTRGCESNSTCVTESDRLNGNKTCCDQDGCNDHAISYSAGLECYDCVHVYDSTPGNPSHQPDCQDPASAQNKTGLTRSCFQSYECRTLVQRNSDGHINKVVRNCETYCIPVQTVSKTITCCNSKDLCNATPHENNGASTTWCGGATLAALLALALLV